MKVFLESSHINNDYQAKVIELTSKGFEVTRSLRICDIAILLDSESPSNITTSLDLGYILGRDKKVLIFGKFYESGPYENLHVLTEWNQVYEHLKKEYAIGLIYNKTLEEPRGVVICHNYKSSERDHDSMSSAVRQTIEEGRCGDPNGHDYKVTITSYEDKGLEDPIVCGLDGDPTCTADATQALAHQLWLKLEMSKEDYCEKTHSDTERTISVMTFEG